MRRSNRREKSWLALSGGAGCLSFGKLKKGSSSFWKKMKLSELFN
jgi:hypothetical protein